MALTPMEARLKMMQERSDVAKALAPAQFELGQQMKEKGEKSAFGSFLGSIVPKGLDYLVGAGLTLVNPALGASYVAAKPLRGLVTGGLQKVGMEKGAEYFGGKVDVSEFEDLMGKYLGETVSGEKAMRFDRGAVESVEAQKDLQLDMLKESIENQATMTGLTTAGTGLLDLLPSLQEITKAKDLKEAGEVKDMVEGLTDIPMAEGVAPVVFGDEAQKKRDITTVLSNLFNILPDLKKEGEISQSKMPVGYEKLMQDLELSRKIGSGGFMTRGYE